MACRVWHQALLAAVIIAGAAAHAKSSSPPKLRILCLHGHNQSVKDFTREMYYMQDAMMDNYEVFYMEAPFPVGFDAAADAEASDASKDSSSAVKTAGSSSSSSSNRSWWHSLEHWKGSADASLKLSDVGWDESYEAIKAQVKRKKADALLGFSQGATAVAMFIAQLTLNHQEQQDLHIPMPKAAILMAAYLPKHPPSRELLQKAKPNVEALFVYGMADEMGKSERTIALSETFEESAAHKFVHAGGHEVPYMSRMMRQALAGFTRGVHKVEAQKKAKAVDAGAVGAAGEGTCSEGSAGMCSATQ